MAARKTTGTRHLLWLAYNFPPAGGAGVQRPVKFIKYLGEHGWQSTVLTVTPGCYLAEDPSLMADLPKDLPIYRVGSWELERLPGLRALRRQQSAAVASPPAGHSRHLLRRPAAALARMLALTLARPLATARARLFLPDPQVGWLPAAYPQALRLLRRQRFDAIISTSAPYSAHLLGLALQARCGLPWLADFRDAWHLDPMGIVANRHLQARLERLVLRRASQVVGTTAGLVASLATARPAARAGCTHVITNGFDPDDFRAPPPERGGPCAHWTLTCVGSIYGRIDAVPLLEALARLCAQVPAVRQALRLRLVGQLDRRAQVAVAAAARRLGLEANLVRRGYVPHGEAIREMRQADVLLLLFYDSPGAADVLPGKIFEYIAAARPIIALAAPGAAANLIRESGCGLVVPPADVAAQQAALMRLWQAHLAGTPPPQPAPTVLAAYDRRRLTAQLATFLDAACAQP